MSKLKISGNKGFSLLEIMVAVAILATSMVVLMALQGSTLLASGRAERLSQATYLARQKMVETEIEIEEDLAKNKFPEQEVEKAGQFEEPFEDFRWKYTLKKVEIPVGDQEGEGNPLIGGEIKKIMDQISKAVREVKITVFWGSKDLSEEEQPNIVVTTHVVKLE